MRAWAWGTVLAAALASLAAAAPDGPRATVPVTTAFPEARADYERGVALLLVGREDEARRSLRAAVRRDPGFALAQARLALVTPGPEGGVPMQRAVSASAGLPRPERLLVEALAARQQGRVDRAARLLDTLKRLVPGDWHVDLERGRVALDGGDVEAAVAAARRAVALAPEEAAPERLLGEAELDAGRAGAALAAYERYAALAPHAADPQDALGAAYLAAGRLREAEAAFREALGRAPGLWRAWAGLAEVRALRGDFAGALDAVAEGAKVASGPDARYEMARWRAAVLGAEGDLDGADRALRALSAAEARSRPDLEVRALLDRAEVADAGGRPEQALALSEEGLARLGGASLPQGEKVALTSRLLVVRTAAEAALGRLEAARRGVAYLADLASRHPADRHLASRVEEARGRVAFAAGRPAAAAQDFARCRPRAFSCAYARVRALEAAGDAAAAEAVRTTIVAAPRRSPLYLFVRGRLGTLPPSAAPGR